MRIRPLIVMMLIVVTLVSVVAPMQARADSGYFCREDGCYCWESGWYWDYNYMLWMPYYNEWPC